MKTANRLGSATVTLPSHREILITRQFDAPAALLFKAYTSPELVKRWWGFDSSEWLVCDIDLRVGGSWRYLTREADGTEVGFHGEYRTIEAPLAAGGRDRSHFRVRVSRMAESQPRKLEQGNG